MGFLTITGGTLTTSQPEKGYSLYFEPSPPVETLPTVWLDLHVDGAYYHDCEDEKRRKPFLVRRATGQRFIRIGPRRGVRLHTKECIGLDCNHTAVVTNVASRAKHGLIVAPGKVDPGFKPHRLVLVVFNQSRRVIVLNEGEKIACIAFLATSSECVPTKSTGHANGILPDYEDTRLQRLKTWLFERDYHSIVYDFFKGVIYVIVAAWILYLLGIRKP